MEIKQEIAQVQKRPETFADIRKETEARFRELVDAWMQRRSTFQTTLGAMQAFNTVFDRLEAAHKLELSNNASKNGADFGQLGDCAKLREALELCDRIIQDGTIVCACDIVDEARTVARVALSKPPRNCDRYASAEEAWDAYDEWADSYKSQGKTEPLNEVGWLFAPATDKEGGAK